ncbi:MAG: GNAT family N-acetyltransferase [Psychrobium sp.]
MITIRRAAIGDLYSINVIYNHYIKHSAITFDVKPWTIYQRLQWCKTVFKNKRHTLLVAVKDDTIIGFAYNGAFKLKEAYKSSTELTVYKAPDCNIKGVGRALYRQLLSYVKQNHYHRAYAWVTLPNEASMHLHKGLGFNDVGIMAQVGKKFDQFHDVALLEKVINCESTIEEEPAA